MGSMRRPSRAGPSAARRPTPVMKTATIGLFDFQHALEGNQDELLAAACIVIMIPTIIMFVFSRKYLMQGMVEGAVKG